VVYIYFIFFLTIWYCHHLKYIILASIIVLYLRYIFDKI